MSVEGTPDGITELSASTVQAALHEAMGRIDEYVDNNETPSIWTIQIYERDYCEWVPQQKIKYQKYQK